MNDRPIKVLAIIETLGRGGAETLLVHLAPSLFEVGVHLEVAHLTPPGTLTDELQARGVAVHDLHGPAPWRADVLVPRLARVIRQREPDIVHAHLFFAGLHTGLLPHWIHRGPRVLSLHCPDYIEQPATTLQKRLRKQLHRLILHHRMTSLVAVSQAVAKHYQKEMQLDAIEVIYNALPNLDFQPGASECREATKSLHGLREKVPLIACVGRFSPQKGHAHLIEAARLLRNRFPEIQIAIVGSGPLEPRYRQWIADRSLTDVVKLVPPMPHRDLMALLEASDIFVMPSLEGEGFGIAAAESMALARPTIVTAIEALRELVTDGKNGLVVPPADPTGLADAIGRLLQDPEHAHKLGSKAKISAQKRFSAEILAPEWARFYRRILTESIGQPYEDADRRVRNTKNR